jgi:hypothetical protein
LIIKNIDGQKTWLNKKGSMIGATKKKILGCIFDEKIVIAQGAGLRAQCD